MAPSLRLPVARRVAVSGRDLDEFSVVAEVREDDAGAEVRVAADDRVADVVQVRGVGAGEEDRALHLDVRADDAAVAHPAAAAQVGADAHFHIFANPAGAFDDGAGGDARALAEDDPVAEEVGAGMHPAEDLGRGERREKLVERRVEERPGAERVVAPREDRRERGEELGEAGHRAFDAAARRW